MAIKSNLYDKYKNTVTKELHKKFNYKSVMEIPKIEKIVINSGLGDATGDSKIIDQGLKELLVITGQKPVSTKSKKSIATFKLRENQAIGAMVTLRRENMWNFLEKLITIAIPRIRDFRGLSTKSFDGRGSYSLGIKEQIIFPEIIYDEIKKIRGFTISIVTSAKTDKEALFLLKSLGMPFVKIKETNN